MRRSNANSNARCRVLGIWDLTGPSYKDADANKIAGDYLGKGILGKGERAEQPSLIGYSETWPRETTRGEWSTLSNTGTRAFWWTSDMDQRNGQARQIPLEKGGISEEVVTSRWGHDAMCWPREALGLWSTISRKWPCRKPVQYYFSTIVPAYLKSRR